MAIGGARFFRVNFSAEKRKIFSKCFLQTERNVFYKIFPWKVRLRTPCRRLIEFLASNNSISGERSHKFHCSDAKLSNRLFRTVFEFREQREDRWSRRSFVLTRSVDNPWRRNRLVNRSMTNLRTCSPQNISRMFKSFFSTWRIVCKLKLCKEDLASIDENTNFLSNQRTGVNWSWWIEENPEDEDDRLDDFEMQLILIENSNWNDDDYSIRWISLLDGRKFEKRKQSFVSHRVQHFFERNWLVDIFFDSSTNFCKQKRENRFSSC